MAHFHIKKKKGRPYLYVREIARVDGKPKVISQIYIGSPERTAALLTGDQQDDVELKVEEFGSLWLGFERETIRNWLEAAGLRDFVYHELQPDQDPGLTGIFVAASTK